MPTIILLKEERVEDRTIVLSRSSFFRLRAFERILRRFVYYLLTCVGRYGGTYYGFFLTYEHGGIGTYFSLAPTCYLLINSHTTFSSHWVYLFSLSITISINKVAQSPLGVDRVHMAIWYKGLSRSPPPGPRKRGSSFWFCRYRGVGDLLHTPRRRSLSLFHRESDCSIWEIEMVFIEGRGANECRR